VRPSAHLALPSTAQHPLTALLSTHPPTTLLSHTLHPPTPTFESRHDGSLAIVRQAELQVPGRTRPLPIKSISMAVAHPPRTASGDDLFSGDADCRIELTPFQSERYNEIFSLIDAECAAARHAPLTCSLDRTCCERWTAVREVDRTCERRTARAHAHTHTSSRRRVGWSRGCDVCAAALAGSISASSEIT
jgi:hypothetical protein